MYKLIGIGVAVLLLLISIFSGCETVQPGQQATIFRPYGKGHDKETVYNPGTYVLMPWNSLIIYDIRQQKYRPSEKMDVLDKNGLPILVDVTAMYHVLPGKTGWLHEKAGPDYEIKIVSPNLHGAAKEVFGRYTAKEIYSDKRPVLEGEIGEELKVILGDNYVGLDKIIITDVDPPASLVDAIKAKETQKENNLTAALKEEQAIKEAAAQKARAEGDAAARIISAEAEAREIDLIQRQIANSPSYIEYLKTQALIKQAEKWSGSYGEGNVFGSDTPILLNKTERSKQ